MIQSIHDKGIVYAIYSRVSTTKEQQRISKAYQDKELQDIGASFQGWVHAKKDYTDDGKSGTNIIHRKGFQDMLKDAKGAKLFNVVIIREVSRFARCVKDFVNCLDYLHNEGVVVYFSYLNILSNDLNAKITLHVMAVLAEMQSIEKSRYSKEAHERRRELGFVFGADNKYGYNLVQTAKGESNKMVINQEEAEVVREIYEMCIGGAGLYTIAKYLNSRLVPTKNGATWSADYISDILHNKAYCGYVRYNLVYKEHALAAGVKWRNRSEHIFKKSPMVEPIISEETYQMAQESLKSRTATYTKGNTVKARGCVPITDVYSAKMLCNCGGTFKRHRISRIKADGTYHIGYTCRNYDKGVVLEGGEKCTVTPIDKVKVDLLALKIFKEIWGCRKEAIEDAYKAISENYHKPATPEGKLDKAEKLRREIQKKKAFADRLFAMLERETISEEDFEDKYAKNQSELKSLNETLEQAEKKGGKKQTTDTRLQAIYDLLNTDLAEETNEQGYSQISHEVINDFVTAITAYADGSFDWYIRLSGATRTPRPDNTFERIPRDPQAMENAVKFMEIEVSYKEACDFVAAYGRKRFVYEKKGKMVWKPLKARVFIEM